MGYVDKYYYGQAKLYVAAETGTTVSVSDGARTWTDVSVSGKASFLLPGTNKYTVTAGDNSQDIYLDYGACAKISL